MLSRTNYSLDNFLSRILAETDEYFKESKYSRQNFMHIKAIKDSLSLTEHVFSVVENPVYIRLFQSAWSARK